MDVIRHNNPGRQAISFTVKVKQSGLNKIRNPWIFEVTESNSSVKVRLNSKSKLIFGLLAIRREFLFPSLNERLRHRIVQPKRDRLEHFAGIEMRQVSATVPTS